MSTSPQIPTDLPALIAQGEGETLEFKRSVAEMERWNTGIRRMRQLMRAHGLPEPIFQEVGQTFKVTFLSPGENILDLIPEAGVTDLRALGLNERQIRALALMVNEGRELTNREYRKIFGVAKNTALRDLDGLVHTGWVKQVARGRASGYMVP